MNTELLKSAISDAKRTNLVVMSTVCDVCGRSVTVESTSSHDCGKIKLTRHTVARDGGTVWYSGSDGNSYYEDHRIGTKTKGSLYDKYPKEKDANILNWTHFEKVP